MDENGDLLTVSISYSKLLWPWSGFMAIFITVKDDGKSFEGTVSGRIRITVSVSVVV
jgi:membrane-bound transcription factor site-1 protease